MKKLIGIIAVSLVACIVYAGAVIVVPEQTKELKVQRIVVDINGQSLGVSVDLSGVDTPLYVSDKTKAYYGKILAPFVSEILALELTAQGYKVTKEYDTILITVEK